jgi:hypothetical protein
MLPEHTMPHLTDFLLLTLALTALYGALGLVAAAFDHAPTLMRRTRRTRPQVFRRVRRRPVRRRRPGAVAADTAPATRAAAAGV